MRKSLLFLLSLLMLMQLPSAWAEGLSFTVAPDSIRPGKMERISFSVSQDGAAGLSLLDADSGEERFVIRQNVAVSAGVNHLTWDGSDLSGAVVAPGQYLLSLQVNGESAVKPLSGFAVSPYWSSLLDYVYCGDPRPSDSAFCGFSDSVAHYSDCMTANHVDSCFPLTNTDDHGTMVGVTDTIYGQGRSTFRRALLSNMMRGTMKLHFYGDVRLLDDGDEVLVPSPDYPLWTACVTLAGGKAVHYICDEKADWNPDMADIERKITPNTKAIVIINPNNPTGALYPRDVLQQIVDIARKHQLMIFSDEIYDRLVMDDLEHISIASMAPDLFCVTFSGLSKSHMIAGYRVGWMILSGNKKLGLDYIQGLNMLSNMRLCSNVPAQSIVQTALSGYQSPKDYVVPGGRIYEQREYIYKALNDIPGITAVKPKAAFYIFPRIDTKKFHIHDDGQFALDLLREKKVLLVQGTGFNWKEPDHFRVVYLPRIEVLKKAISDLGDFLTTYRQ